MKKLISFSLALLLAMSGTAAIQFSAANAMKNETFTPDPAVIDMTHTRTTDEFVLRDPCVVVYGGYYFMYGTGAASPGYGCYVSRDLVNWAGPVRVYAPPAGFDADGCWWAPECHQYNGMFYIFATYRRASTGHRGVSIFRSASPLGPFEEISDGHVTPADRDAIDGTLYIDPDGTPWMVFVQEWTSADDGTGRMAAAKLNADLTAFISEPVELFRADDALWCSNSNVTDGPWLYTTSEGKLIMIWSNFATRGGYAVGVAHSLNGKIDGKWVQETNALYCRDKSVTGLDGGHGMIFTDLDGRLMMAIHSPNKSNGTQREEAVIIELEDTGRSIRLRTDAEKESRAIDSLKRAFSLIISIVTMIFQSILFK